MGETNSAPVARSPIPAPQPTAVVDGWLVSTRAAGGQLVLVDRTPRGKALVRTSVAGGVADHLGVPHGRSGRDGSGRLVLGTGPGEWLVLAAAGEMGLTDGLAEELAGHAGADELLTVVEATHGRALLRLTGPRAAEVLARVCDLDLERFADGAVARTVVAGVVTELARDDRDGPPSYLAACEPSSGRYLHERFCEVGEDLGIEVAGAGGDAAP